MTCLTANLANPHDRSLEANKVHVCRAVINENMNLSASVLVSTSLSHRPPFIIAEIAQAHDGSLGTALAYIKLAKEWSRCSKVSTHIADEESTLREP